MSRRDELLATARDWAGSIDRETPQGGVDAEILYDLIAAVEDQENRS